MRSKELSVVGGRGTQPGETSSRGASGQNRREFLQAGSVSLFAAASRESSVEAAAPAAKSPYRAAIVGCGRKGTGYARGYVLHPRTEVVAAADIDPANLELFTRRFGVPGYQDYREMLAREKVDVVSPILPVKANPGVVLGCTEFPVKAIYCEKPISASLGQADEMVEACKRKGIVFAGGDMYRNFPQFWQARDALESGELGEVRGLNLYQSTNEISGGGCQGLSVMRLFARDAPVEWVCGWTRGDPFSDQDQGMGGTVRFSNGMECFIHNQPVARMGIEVLCAKGVFVSDWYTFRLFRMKASAKDPRRRDSLEEIPGLYPDSGLGRRVYDGEGWRHPGTRQMAGIQSLVDALEKGIPPRTSGDDLRLALELGVALRQSHRQGYAPVRLPVRDRELKILPHVSRYLNKKEVHGEEWYREQMEGWKRDPQG